MPIRILHVVEAFGVGGGIETGVGNLIRYMDRSRFEHVLCAVFRVGPLVERYTAERVQLVCLEQKERRFSTQFGPLAQAIRTIKPDIVHSRNWGALEAVLAARWTGSCRVIHSEHGVELNPSAEPLRRRGFRRLAFGLAHRVFAVSYQLRQTLAERTGFPLANIHVIHNGVDTTRFRRDPETRRRVRADFGAADHEFCIGCVGRLSRIKDYPTILRAADVFSRSCPSWRLFIVGGGSELSALQQLVSSSPALSGRVHFAGPSDRVAEFLTAIDVYVLPSICEGISNSLLEAMAAGVPVIATHVGGNPEVVVDGESGLLFPVGDVSALAGRLTSLYKQKELRERLGREACRRVSDEFSLKAMVRNYEAMYESLARRTVSGREIETALCGAGK